MTRFAAIFLLADPTTHSASQVLAIAETEQQLEIILSTLVPDSDSAHRVQDPFDAQLKADILAIGAGETDETLRRAAQEFGDRAPVLVFTAPGIPMPWMREVAMLRAGAADVVFVDSDSSVRQRVLQHARRWADPTVAHGDLIIDRRTWELHVSSIEVELGGRALMLMEKLARAKGGWVSDGDLISYLYPDSDSEEFTAGGSFHIGEFLAVIAASFAEKGIPNPIESEAGRHRLR